ncbi:MAG: PIG-L family deacetylase [Clostridia bacterium]|nr:PIG-L family deacetylase [Clostridia bacterium]
MREKMRIMVIAGHPADMFDHCGGTLYHHIQQGDEVTCVALTQGLRIHDEVIYDIFRHHIDEYTQEEIDRIVQERQDVKYAEAKEAAGLFGIKDIRFLDYDDELLTLNAAVVSRLAKVIREVNPDVVITHWPHQWDTFSNHHAVTGQIALSAVTAASSVNFEDSNPACVVGQIFFMLCPADVSSYTYTGDKQTAHIMYEVDVTDVVDLKVRAINTMKSQKYNTRGYAHKTTEAWNGQFGERIRVAYAEAFAMEFPEAGHLLPYSDHRRWLAKGDERDHLRRMSGLQSLNTKLEEID